jgi:hypothetical protein
MLLARALRVSATSAALALVVGTVTTTAAEAKPTKPGGVPNVAGVATWHSGTTYDVNATWGAVANATGYRVSIVKGATTLASKTVTTLSWDPTVTSGPGQATLQVQAVINHSKGAATRVTVVLPDKIAPTGAFSTSKVDVSKQGTITQTALADDSGVAGITRTVSWGDASGPVAWTAGTQISHTYAAIGRYVPTVTLTDAANNSVEYTLDAIVLGDVTAPTGSMSVAPAAAWAGFTKVVATPSALADDVSPSDKVAVHVAWDDGSTSDSQGSAPLEHVYAAAGTYHAAVTLTDEAGNPTSLGQFTVTVTADTVAPTLRFVLPRSKHSVKAFSTLRGKATDTGTGVASVTLKAIEKRGSAWYGYNAQTKRWVKAATKTRAFGRARAAVVKPNSKNAWAVALSGLRKGTLVYRAFATDRVANRSGTLSHQATLTAR